MVKYLESVVVWGVFSGNYGIWGLFFLFKNITLDGGNDLEILEQHMLPIWGMHQCHDFLYDGAPPRNSKLVKMLQEDREIRIWGCPGNFPYLILRIPGTLLRTMHKRSSQQALQTSTRCSLTYRSI